MLRNGWRGFSLVELLVTIAVISVLAAAAVGGISKVIEEARYAQCVGNLRALAAGAVSFATDRDGKFWSQEEVGYSRFRSVDDPLGVPMLLKEYLPNQQVWWCKSGRSTLKKFGNNYAWAISTALDQKTIIALNPKSQVLFWDNYSYTQPSIFGVRDGGTTGPPAASLAYRHYPHFNRKKACQVYMGGHVVFEGSN